MLKFSCLPEREVSIGMPSWDPFRFPPQHLFQLTWKPAPWTLVPQTVDNRNCNINHVY